MDVVAGGVDVGDDVVDDVVGVAEQPAAVAADRREAGDRLADAEQRLVARRDVRLGLGLALVPAIAAKEGSRAIARLKRAMRRRPMLVSPKST